MSARSSWLTLGAVVVLVGVLSLLRGGQPADSPEHSSSSDARQGTSALLLYAQALGHPTSTLSTGFDLAPSHDLLFVFTPTRSFSKPEAQQLRDWVSSGGTLVYASNSDDAELDAALGLERLSKLVPAAATAPAPSLAGVHQVSGDLAAQPFSALPGQAPVLRASGGEALGLWVALGEGRVLALADPLPLCNAFLSQADNGRLAADLISLAGPGGAVIFDEYHHAAVTSGSAQGGWETTSWGMALLWAVLAFFAGLALRGRAFGPRLPLRPPGEPSGRAYLTAVAEMLSRARARAEVLLLLQKASQLRLEQRAGIRSGSSVPAAPGRPGSRLEEQLAALQEAMEGGDASDQALVRAAQGMHALAHPLQTLVP